MIRIPRKLLTAVALSAILRWSPAAAQDPAAPVGPPASVPPPAYYESSELVEYIEDDLPIVYTQAEAVFMDRTSGENVPLGQQIDLNTGAVLATTSTNDQDFRFEPGVRVLIGVPLNRDTALEFTYLGIYDWISNGTLSTSSNMEPVFPNFMQFGIIPAGEGDTVGPQFQYLSNLRCIDLTVRRSLWEDEYRRVFGLLGFRYNNLREQFNIDQRFEDPEVRGERTSAAVQNHMIGVQFGGQFVEYFGPMTLGLTAKGGIYANVGHQHILNGQDLTSGNIQPINLSATETDLGGSFDLGFNFTYMFTRCLVFRAGYNLTLLTSMALAHEQLPANLRTVGPLLDRTLVGGPAVLDQDGVVFYHGPSVGFEVILGGPRR